MYMYGTCTRMRYDHGTCTRMRFDSTCTCMRYDGTCMRYDSTCTCMSYVHVHHNRNTANTRIQQSYTCTIFILLSSPFFSVYVKFHSIASLSYSIIMY